MIKFGPSGNSDEFYEQGYSKSIEAPKWLSEKGLNAYEYSFGRGILMNEDTAIKLKEEAAKYNIEISVHAPYYINFANPDDEMAEKSYNYVLSSLRMLKLLGGRHCVVHPATVGKMNREDAVKLTSVRLKELAKRVRENGLGNMKICLETMGKVNQIGTYKEIVDFCKLDNVYLPTFDFGHINALTQGSLKTEEDYEEIIKYLFDNLDEERAKNIHIHFSKIEYSKGGEVKHLTFEDNIYGPEFEPLAHVLKKYNMTPVIICESKGTMAKDALTMKKIYENVK